MHSLTELMNYPCDFENVDIYYSAKTFFHWHFFFPILLGFLGFEFSLRPSQLHRKTMLKQQLGFCKSGRGLETIHGLSCFSCLPCWFAQFLTAIPCCWLRSHHFDTSALHSPSHALFHISTEEMVSVQVLQHQASLGAREVSWWCMYTDRESFATNRWSA